MDQINQVLTGATPGQDQPAQTPAQPAKESTPAFAPASAPSPSPSPSPTPAPSPPPLSQLPSFAPKKSNIKLWLGVIGGILIVVIGSVMIFGKTKIYKGELTDFGHLNEEQAKQKWEEYKTAAEKSAQEATQYAATSTQTLAEIANLLTQASDTNKNSAQQLVNDASEKNNEVQAAMGNASQKNQEVLTATAIDKAAQAVTAAATYANQAKQGLDKVSAIKQNLQKIVEAQPKETEEDHEGLTEEEAKMQKAEKDANDAALSAKQSYGKAQTAADAATALFNGLTEDQKKQAELIKTNAENFAANAKDAYNSAQTEANKPATTVDEANTAATAAKKSAESAEAAANNAESQLAKMQNFVNNLSATTPTTETRQTGSTGVETKKIDETSEKFLVAQAEMDALKELCDNTSGAKWNEDGNNSSCVFEDINFKNLQAFKTKIDQVSKQAQTSGSQHLGAASDESQAIATIAKIGDAARDVTQDAEYIASLLKKYPDNTEIQSANTKAQNAKATAEDALGFAKGATDPAILKTLLGKAELAASKVAEAKTAAQNAADAELLLLPPPPPPPPPSPDVPSAPPSPTPAEEIAALKTEIANSKDQLKIAASNNNDALINQLVASIATLNSKIEKLGGQQVIVNVPEYKYPSAQETACADPSFVYDPFKKKCIAPTLVGASSGAGTGSQSKASQAKGKKGAMETPEMWGDQVKSSTIETPEMWGDSTEPAKPKTGAAAATKGYGATIQGKTGPGVLLYPVFIAGANSLYYLLRKRRKNKK
ncbi:hypothetical protein HZC21_00420 [Candidatus Peregrinibacteria bacterium]|nr:hypothetical protein [Candidatus Peregrinibacteria bacterium]